MLTVSGVSIGIASIIFLVSLGYGLESLVTNQVANFNAFTVFDVSSANIKNISIDDAAVSKITGFAHVSNVAPVTSIAGRIKKADSSSNSETVIVAADASYWKLAEVMATEGSLPTNASEIMVNQSILTLMGESADTIIGKKIKLDIIIPAEVRTNPVSGLKLIENSEFTVVGYSDSNKAPMVFIPMDILRLNDAAKYSSLKVKAESKDFVFLLRQQIENMGLVTDYVGDTVSEIQQVFSLFRVILGAFGLIALIVASIGTFNTLTISLLERTREIGLFKALGMRNRDVYKLFLSESLIIGFLGGILGVAIGVLAGMGIDALIALYAQRSGAENIVIFDTPWIFAAGTAGLSLVIGFITGWYPSRRAVKMNPLDALRYE
jgi:putative ABC transport system permease protein